ncbi:alpha/beta hydrolase [Prolixibacteraceae bacterium Z1-6]|uniref:Alpha/beta hydrolase n=1 Tax=Draconibacterium aestuarii TaxID=2998507 RepID=A0A9X3J560_9BACT|nr:alpha/beta hydrolase [Prolixibacteraceae bacterium Z1-6]
MTNFLKLAGNFLKWILIVLILLFALATFMGKSYLQTIVLLLIAVFLAWWPNLTKAKWSKKISLFSRIGIILILILPNIFCFNPEPKTSIYLTEEYKNELHKIYDNKVKEWPADTEDIFLETQYGKVHILVCGSTEKPPLIMIHAASMGAHSWAENLEPLLGHFRIYSFDNIGEGNKSELRNALVYPQNGKELADLYASMANELGIKSCPVLGASNGGFAAQNFAYYYPDKVEKLALFGPMGLTQLTGKSIFMLAVATIYPFDSIRDYVTKWALGENEYVNKKYGDWFNCILRGTIPSLATPVPMTQEQKEKMNLPVLLFLGTKDAIVGDAEMARQKAKKYPNIEIEILESGHLIAVEQAEYVNKKLKLFLNIDN